MVNDGNEKKRNATREYAQKERENVASTEFHRHGERSVHSLSDQRLKAYLEWDECLYVSLARLPRRIHSLFHFKCSAAFFWVAALSLRPLRCTYHSFCSPSPSLACGPYGLWFIAWAKISWASNGHTITIFLDFNSTFMTAILITSLDRGASWLIHSKLIHSDLFFISASRAYNCILVKFFNFSMFSS